MAGYIVGTRPQIVGRKCVAANGWIIVGTRWPRATNHWPTTDKVCYDWPRLATVGHVSTSQTVANCGPPQTKCRHDWPQLATVGHVSTSQTVANGPPQIKCGHNWPQFATVGHVSTSQTVATLYLRWATVGHMSTSQTVANRIKSSANVFQRFLSFLPM
jgi:hypothetical protein